MKWRTTTNDDFTEDWMFSHYRYKHSNDKLDTDLFEVRDRGLVKIGGNGRLEFNAIEVLDESEPPTPEVGKGMEELKEVVYTEIGYASMCWSETPTGIFDATKASLAGELIMAAVERYCAAKDAENDNLKRDFLYWKLEAIEKDKQLKELREAYEFPFSEWVSHNDWTYLPSKKLWFNEEDEEYITPMTTNELYQLYLKSK